MCVFAEEKEKRKFNGIKAFINSTAYVYDISVERGYFWEKKRHDDDDDVDDDMLVVKWKQVHAPVACSVRTNYEWTLWVAS